MVRKSLWKKNEKSMENKAALMIQAAFRGHVTRKNILATNNEFRILERKKMVANLLRAVKTIQSHWRGWKIRKLYKEMCLELATKAMQTKYFHQQIELLGNEMCNSIIKTTYQIYPNEFAGDGNSTCSYNELINMNCIHCVSGQVIVPANMPIMVSSCCPPVDDQAQQQLKNGNNNYNGTKVTAFSHKNSVSVI